MEAGPNAYQERNKCMKILKESAEMDEFNASAIGNQAHQIIYKSIYEKLKSLSLDKNKFKDESDRLYLKEILLYFQAQEYW